jgi:hypothetical protein
MRTSRAQQINEAIESREFVRIRRRFEDTFVRGYVLVAGPRHFVVALVSDRLWYDGFECFRIADVRSIEPDPYAAFAELALRKRGQRKLRFPRLALESTRSLLDSAGALFPIVTIHMEKVEPGICHIGHIVGTTARQFALLEIGPSAEWDTVASSFPINEITRINFGGDYEEALSLVGGPGPL